MPTHITIQITDTAFPKTFMVPITKRIVFGRSDEDYPSYKPDIDLVGCNAISNGISRQHAALDVQSNGDCILVDLGSRNGTAVNGNLLEPHFPEIIRDGDKIQLGRLQITVFFDER